ncbi:MAG: hypothetical protein ABIJ96_16935 [Elusimicrobiota bacterium]
MKTGRLLPAALAALIAVPGFAASYSSISVLSRCVWRSPDSALVTAAHEARRRVKQSKEERRRRRDAVLAAWIRGIPPGQRRVIVRCFGEPCTPDQRESDLNRLVGLFERMPVFLQAANLKQVQWKNLPAGSRPDGMGLKGKITLFVPPEAPVDRILSHELAHIYIEDHAAEVAPFLALRYKTGEMRRALAELRAHLDRSGYRGGSLDDRARELVALARIPQRFPDDLHAAANDSGYWSVAIELSFIAGRDADASGLKNYSPAEIAWIEEKLAGRGE